MRPVILAPKKFDVEAMPSSRRVRMSNYVIDQLQQTRETIDQLSRDTMIHYAIEEVAQLCVRTLKSGNKLLFAGNGGSAADAQHIAAEFVSRFMYDRPGLAALAL